MEMKQHGIFLKLGISEINCLKYNGLNRIKHCGMEQNKIAWGGMEWDILQWDGTGWNNRIK